IDRHEEPAITASTRHSRSDARGRNIGVDDPLTGSRGTIFVRQAGEKRARYDGDFVSFLRKLDYGERDRRTGQTDDSVDLLSVDPAARDAECDIRLVLMVRRYYLDTLTGDHAAGVFDGHPCSLHRPRPRQTRIRSRQVRQDPDANNIIRNLSKCPM